MGSRHAHVQRCPKSLPPGTTSAPRHTWVVHIWPFIEQGTLQTSYGDISAQQFYLPPAIVQNAFTGVAATQVSIYYCPSDRPGARWSGDSYFRARANYVVNWGARTAGGLTTSKAPFGLQPRVANPTLGDSANPQLVRFASITDGHSNTLMMSEVIVARNDNDFRTHGDIFNDDLNSASAIFMTRNVPNTSVPDSMYCNINNDLMAPCVPPAGAGANFEAARSRHLGGVNVMFCDGSVRFVANTILLATWQALGSMDGGEPIGDY